MKGKSIKGKSIEEIKSALLEAIADGFVPTLAFIFSSISLDIKGISELFNKVGIQIFGSTTDGEVYEDEICEGAATILLLDINTDYFKVFIEEVGQGGYFEASRSIANKALAFYPDPAFIFAGTGIYKDPYIERIIEGFKDILGPQASVFGGMAGSDMIMGGASSVFVNNQISTDAEVAIAFDARKISVKGIATCNWKPIGTSKTITNSKENRVYKIDNLPPLELTMKYAGINELPDNLFDIQKELNHTLQIQLQRDEGDSIMRVGLANMEDKSFSFIGSMPEGARIKFCLLPDLETLDETIEEVNNLKNHEMPEADAILYFACAGRLLAFGPAIIREIDGINKVWNAPMTGFFCQGEFGKATGGALEAHNLTTVCVALKEI